MKLAKYICEAIFLLYFYSFLIYNLYIRSYKSYQRVILHQRILDFRHILGYILERNGLSRV